MKRLFIITVVLLLCGFIENKAVAEEMFVGLNKNIEKHSLGGSIKSEMTVENILHQAHLEFKAEDTAPSESSGIPNRLITAKDTGADLVIEGRPYVTSVSITIIPADEDNAIFNLHSIVMMSAALNTFCLYNKNDRNDVFFKQYSDFIGSNKLKHNGLAGKCKYEMIQPKKNSSMQFSIVTFKSKN